EPLKGNSECQVLLFLLTKYLSSCLYSCWSIITVAGSPVGFSSYRLVCKTHHSLLLQRARPSHSQAIPRRYHPDSLPSSPYVHQYVHCLRDGQWSLDSLLSF